MFVHVFSKLGKLTYIASYLASYCTKNRDNLVNFSCKLLHSWLVSLHFVYAIDPYILFK